MYVTHSPTANALYIKLNNQVVAQTKKASDSVILDFDADGHLIGIELLDVGEYVDNPSTITYEQLTEAIRPSEETIRAQRQAIKEARQKRKTKTK
ncbi:MAG: DUF2283 domain-containing protein [Anaerolineae bacterium]|nr:DUF2283 domain-containing protein [Anaerolineae bacterium]